MNKRTFKRIIREETKQVLQERVTFRKTIADLVGDYLRQMIQKIANELEDFLPSGNVKYRAKAKAINNGSIINFVAYSRSDIEYLIEISAIQLKDGNIEIEVKHAMAGDPVGNERTFVFDSMESPSEAATNALRHIKRVLGYNT